MPSPCLLLNQTNKPTHIVTKSGKRIISRRAKVDLSRKDELNTYLASLHIRYQIKNRHLLLRQTTQQETKKTHLLDCPTCNVSSGLTLLSPRALKTVSMFSYSSVSKLIALQKRSLRLPTPSSALDIIQLDMTCP